ncbi:MAG TPA: Gfo/Idh/MocA family oxidoreductase [Chitinophagaceae bacterium]|nr:Gfo/Idh/MocA family oxidoreductase [Chitinophagaceae bacterium]
MTNTIIKTGICSYGMSGKLFHAPFLEAHPGYELSAIVERHNHDSKERYPNAKLYRSVEEFCADKDIQLIVVNTPTHLHFEQAKMVLNAGKNMVIEKPFAITVKEAEELAALAEKNKLFLSVYQNRRYDGDYRAVKAVLEKEMLGEVREAEIRYDRYRPVFGGKPHKEGNLPGAGNIYDLSPHLVDQAIQLFGFPKALFADLIKMRDDVGVPDYFELLFYYDRLRVRLKATVIARESTYAYVIHGMKGSFLQQRSDLQEQQLLAGVKPSLESWCPAPASPDGLLHTEINGQVVREETNSSPGNYMGYYDDVYKALTGQGANPVPAADGIKNMRIIEAALESVKQKKVVEF